MLWLPATGLNFGRSVAVTLPSPKLRRNGLGDALAKVIVRNLVLVPRLETVLQRGAANASLTTRPPLSRRMNERARASVTRLCSHASHRHGRLRISVRFIQLRSQLSDASHILWRTIARSVRQPTCRTWEGTLPLVVGDGHEGLEGLWRNGPHLSSV